MPDEPEVIGKPILQVFELSNGEVRVMFDLKPELGGVLASIGAIIQQRKGLAT